MSGEINQHRVDQHRVDQNSIDQRRIDERRLETTFAARAAEDRAGRSRTAARQGPSQFATHWHQRRGNEPSQTVRDPQRHAAERRERGGDLQAKLREPDKGRRKDGTARRPAPPQRHRDSTAQPLGTPQTVDDPSQQPQRQPREDHEPPPTEQEGSGAASAERTATLIARRLDAEAQADAATSIVTDFIFKLQNGDAQFTIRILPRGQRCIELEILDSKPRGARSDLLSLRDALAERELTVLRIRRL